MATCHDNNKKLVYAHFCGWWQSRLFALKLGKEDRFEYVYEVELLWCIDIWEQLKD